MGNLQEGTIKKHGEQAYYLTKNVLTFFSKKFLCEVSYSALYKAFGHILTLSDYGSSLILNLLVLITTNSLYKFSVIKQKRLESLISVGS